VTVRVLTGDCREVLRSLEPQSVNLVVTSPPYMGLRDYQTGTWQGGDPECDHESRRHLQGATGVRADRTFTTPLPMRGECRRCGAVRVDGQIGLEATPEEFVEAIVYVFREVRRVLRDDGVVYLNLGDTYAGSGRGGNPTENTSTLQGGQDSQRASMVGRSRAPVVQGKRVPGGGMLGSQVAADAIARPFVPPFMGLKQKDLIGIPWRVAFALQSDGWWLRQDIVWSKPNPMPESVTDRCTKAHEYLFQLSKSERYYFDRTAIQEPATFGEPNSPDSINSPHGQGFTRRARSGNKARKGPEQRGAPVSQDGKTKGGAVAESVPWEGNTRNKRSVWTVSTTPFSGEFCTSCRTFFQGKALRELKVEEVVSGERKTKTRHCTCGATDSWLSHFATFPTALIEPCISAACPPGGTVLDPFGGAGTTGLVADRLGRNAVLIELNPDYAEMARQRIRAESPLLTEVA
jgi:DNA modification methylase